MTRIPTPASIDDAPEAARPLLNAVKAQLGSAPNLFRITANSPAALEGPARPERRACEGPACCRHARADRSLSPSAQVNGCDYCLAAHSYIGKNLARLSDAEIAANRQGRSDDVKASAAVAFAVRLVQQRGAVSETDVAAVRNAGYGDGEIVEIIAHVALNTLTNYLNEALETEVDFPRVPTAIAA